MPSVSLFLLAENNTLIYFTDDDGIVPLWEAIQCRNLAIAEALWNHGARLTHELEEKFLSNTAENESLEVLQDMLKYGVNVNAQISDGCTPLHVSTSMGNIHMTNFLMDQGANPSLYDARRLQPLDLAKQQEQENLVNLLPQYIGSRKDDDKVNKGTSLQIAEKEDMNKALENGLDNDTLSAETMHGALNTPTCGINHSTHCTRSYSKHNHCKTLEVEKREGRGVLCNYSRNVERSIGRARCGPIRVVIHPSHPKGSYSVVQLGKLINIPSSLQDLLQIASMSGSLFLHYTVLFLVFFGLKIR